MDKSPDMDKLELDAEQLWEQLWTVTHYICNYIEVGACSDRVLCHTCAQSHLDAPWFKKEVSDDGAAIR